MKQSKASKTLLAIVTILTVMMALIVPSPAYAAKEPPPPPPPPSNDTGGKISGPSHSGKNVPNDTTVVVTDNGTPVSLAAQLATDTLSAEGASPKYVKFCVGTTCNTFTDVEGAINAAKAASDATGATFTIYVDTSYSLSGTFTLLPPTQHLTALTIDQAPAGWVDQTMALAMIGGVDISNNGKKGVGTSKLAQTLNIKNINNNSSFAMDSFVFTIGTLGALGLPGDVMKVTDSNNVTLSNLSINVSNTLGGNGIGVYNSNNVAFDTVNVNRSAGLYGDGIHVEDSGPVALKDVTVTNTNTLLGDGIHITGSHDISLDNVSATSKNVYGAYLSGNSDGLSITNSTFSNSGYTGLYVTGQNGNVDLTNVIADKNGSDVLDAVKQLLPGQASGAAFVNNSGALSITGSEFDANATSGLWVFNQTNGSISLMDSDLSGNAGIGFTALTPLLAGDTSVSDSGFTGNGGNGLTVLSLGNVNLNDSLFTGNGGEGANATSLLGDVAVDPSTFSGNTGNGLTVLALVGDVTLEDSLFTDNGGDGASVTATLGSIDANHNQFKDNVGNGLTALALDNIYLGDSGFFKNGGDGAFVKSLDGNIGVDNSIFARNMDNGLEALATGGIILGNSGFFRNGGDGALTTSLDSIAAVDNIFAGNAGNGLTALSMGDVTLADLGFFRNGGDGASVAAAVGGVVVDNSLFSRNAGNGLKARTLTDILVGDSGFFDNGGDGAFTTSLFGGTAVLGDAFAGNGKNGLTALSLNDIFLAGVIASDNKVNGAELTSGRGDVGVFESVFGNLPDAATVTGGGPVYSGNGENGLVATTLVGDVVLDGVVADQNGDNGIVASSLLGNIGAESVFADQNGIIGALLTSVTGSVDVEDSGFDNNGGVGLVGLGLQDVFLGWTEASGNQYAGATLAILGDVVVTNSSFFGASNIYLPEYAPQMLGLGILGGDVVLDNSTQIPGAFIVDPTDYGVNASGNGVMGALILSTGDIQIGDSIFDENGGSVASLGLLSLLGNGVVAVGGLGGDGSTMLFNTEANGNTSFGAVLFNTDLVGVYYDSAFDNNGLGGLLGVSLGDVELFNIEASGNSLLGAATLSGGYTSVADSVFDSNLGGVGLLSVALGPISAENVDASNNGILGAGLVSIDTYDLTGFVAPGGSACSEDTMFSGDICVNKMTANDNGFIGAAILGTDWVEVDNSQFTGNDALGSLLGIIPGGGLVVIGGESTVLDKVTADQNFGFGAVVGNTGGGYDLISGMIGGSSSNAAAISQMVTGSATALDLSGLPLFTDTGDISITNSSFSNNDAFGLLSVSNGDLYLDHVAANGNGTFGASLFAEGNITVKHSTFNHNGTFGLSASIFSPAGATLTDAATHTVYLHSVDASNNGDYGAMVQANTTDNVDVTVTNSTFNENHGTTTGGLGIFATGDVLLDHVIANQNAGDGVNIFGNSVDIRNSRFNYNDGHGIVINSLVHTSIVYTNACHNKLGPLALHSPDLFTDHFVSSCGNDGIGSGPTEENPLPWQIINVMMDTGKNSGTLSCLFGTTFLYLEKQTAPMPDFEWARAVLSACIVPGGSTGTFLGLAEGALPGALPSGITFQGKAFDLSITGPNGQPVDTLGGPMMVRFTLPDGFTLPSGKKLDILWWDPAGKKWVELNTYAGGKYAWGFAGNDGTFALTIK